MDPADHFNEAHRELLLELSLLISERRGVDEIFAIFAERLRHGVTFQFTSLFVATADPEFVRAVAHYPDMDFSVPPGSIQPASAMGSDRLPPEGTEYVPRKVDLQATKLLASAGYERAWVSPLNVDGKHYGILTVAKKSHGAFPDQEIGFLRAAGTLLARAVRQDLELEQARRQAARAQVARDLTVAIQADEPLESIFRRLPPLLADCLATDYIGLILQSPGGYSIDAEAPAGIHADDSPSDAGDRLLRSLARRGDFFQFRTEAEQSASLHGAGFRRGALAFLRDGEDLLGALMLARKTSRQFDDDESRFVELLRSILSQSLSNQKRIARSEAAAARARTLNELALLLSAGEGTDAIFQRLHQLLAPAVAADYLALMEVSPDRETARVVGTSPDTPGIVGVSVPAASLGISDMAAGGTFLLEYATADLRDSVDAVRRIDEMGMRRGLNVLLGHEGSPNGLLVLARRQKSAFSMEERAFLETLGAMLGQAIANRQRLVAAESEAARLQLLNDLGLLLNNGESLSAHFHILAERLGQAVSFDGLVLVAASKQPGVFRVVQSRRGQAFLPGQVIRNDDFGANVLDLLGSGVAVVEGRNRDLGGQVALRAAEYGIERGALVPLRHGSETLGYLFIGRARNRAFRTEETQFLEIVGTIVGQAIANLRKVEDKDAQAIRSRVLSEVTQLLQNGGRINDHFQRLSELVLQAVGFDFMSIRTFDASTDEYSVIRTHELELADDHRGNAPALIQGAGSAATQYRTASLDRPVPQALSRAGFERAATAVIPGAPGKEGLLTIGRHENERFSAEEMTFIELLAALLGQALTNFNEAAAKDAEALRSRVLSELAILVNDGEPLSAHFERLQGLLVEGVGFDFCALSVVQNGGNAFRTMRSHSLPGEDGNEYVLPISVLERASAFDGTGWQYGREGVAIGAPQVMFDQGMERAATFILKAGEGVEGLLTIGRRAPRPFTPSEMTFFEIVGTLLANAAANERRLEVTASEAVDNAILAEAARVVASETSALAVTRGLRAAVARFIENPFVNFGYRVGDEIHFPTRAGGIEVHVIGRYFREALDHGQAYVPGPSDAEAGGNVRRYLASGLKAHVITRAAAAGHTVGVLVIGSRDLDFHPGERELRLTSLIADIVGPAMANWRNLEVERQEAQDQAIIGEAAAAVARGTTTLEIIRGLRHAVGRFIPSPFVNFGYLEGGSVRFPSRIPDLELLRIDNHFLRAFRDGFAIVPATTLRIAQGEDLADVAQSGLEAHILTRTSSSGATTGLLVVGSRDVSFEPSARDVRLCRLIADIAGPAMANARAVEREREEAEEQRVIAEVAAVAARERQPGAMVAALQAPVRGFIPKSFLAFGFMDGAETVFPQLDGSMLRFPMDEPTRRTSEQGQVVWSEPPPTFHSVEAMRSLNVQTLCSTAILSGGATVGVLLVGSRLEGFAFQPRQLRMIRLIAQIVGPAMENSRAAIRALEDAEEQSILAQAAAAVAAGTSQQEITAALPGSIHRFLPGAIVRTFFLRGAEELGFEGISPGFGAAAAEALATGQAFIQRPWPAISETGRKMLDDGGIVKFVNTALNAAGESRGILFVGLRDDRVTVGERELRLLRLIGDITGPAMANARASHRAKEDAEEQSILAEAAAAVAAGTSQQEITAALARPIRRFLPGARVLAFFLRPDDSERFEELDAKFGSAANETLTDGQVLMERPWTDVSEESRRMLDEAGMTRYVNTALNAGGTSQGLLFAGVRNPDLVVGERELRLLRLIAGIAGPGYAAVRESARRADEAEEQRFLADIASGAARAADENELVRGLREPFRRFVPGAHVLFFYFDGDLLHVPGDSTKYGMSPQGRQALEEGQSVGTLEDAGIPGDRRAYYEELGLYSWCDTRASSGGEHLGLLFVGAKANGFRFHQRERNLCRLAADIIGPALANLRESSRRKEEAEEQRVLAEAAAALAAGTSEQDLLGRLARVVRSFVPRALVSFSYIDGDEMALYDGRNRRPIHGHIRKALRSGQEVGQLDSTEMTDVSRDLIAGAGIQHWVDTIANSAGTAIGILFVGTPLKDITFSERQLRLLRLISDFTGPAMVNAREDERRRREAEDERILSEIAAVAARAEDSSVLIAALAPAISGVIPNALMLYGFVEGESVVYQIPDPDLRQQLGSSELRLPISGVGRSARDTGHGIGNLSGGDPARAYSALNLQEYCLTSYLSAGAPVGLLAACARDPEFHFDDRSVALLRRITQVVGPAVESSRAAAERDRQAQLYSLMLRSLTEAVVLSDVEGRIVFANELGRQILHGLDPNGEAVRWQDMLDRLPEEAREGYRAVSERGEGFRGRSTLTVDGKPRWFDYELVPLNDPAMRILLVAADVTTDVERELEQLRHREQMEQAQRLAALGELIGGVAHELNNPLTAILGFAEVMALSPAAETLSEELSIIQKEALRARNIVRDLLFIVRPGTAESAEIPVTELIAHIERLRKTAWVQQGIHWRIDIEEPCKVWGNENQLTQVILNLVNNAEHALQGQPLRQISVHARSVGANTEIAVSDTGTGMDDATRGRVFEPFFTTKQGHGTGLGLPLSYSIVQAHGGEILVDSVIGQGTTFTLLLPSAPTVDQPAERTVEDHKEGTIRVLVVDDEPSLRKVCQRLIASMGHECVTAENSTAAAALAANQDFDVVLCDYRLAAETANDVVQALERVAPQLVSRIVIATGATTDPGVVELTERHGFPLIAKPYGREELGAAIQRRSQ